ncbi:DUF397 domain-containing protein [Actinoallomurus sp. NPDC052274]|uniref:DUF397 domain-containing protein n=1 Tax=Actinoallomurus sp. NPDC052274 TaxID=3155420 RepID=UPI003420ED4E
MGASWRKSPYSGGDEGNCVEVAGVWRKSSRSGGDEGECVEVTVASVSTGRGERKAR